MTASYSKNFVQICLFAIHWTVNFHPAWALKHAFFFFLTFCRIIIPVFGIIDH